MVLNEWYLWLILGVLLVAVSHGHMITNSDKQWGSQKKVGSCGHVRTSLNDPWSSLNNGNSGLPELPLLSRVVTYHHALSPHCLALLTLFSHGHVSPDYHHKMRTICSFQVKKNYEELYLKTMKNVLHGKFLAQEAFIRNNRRLILAKCFGFRLNGT